MALYPIQKEEGVDTGAYLGKKGWIQSHSVVLDGIGLYWVVLECAGLHLAASRQHWYVLDSSGW